MAEHEHGSMNFDVQQKTFDNFMSIVTKTSIAIIVLLILMAIFIS